MALQTPVNFYIAEIRRFIFLSRRKTFIRGDFENDCQKLGLAIVVQHVSENRKFIPDHGGNNIDISFERN